MRTITHTTAGPAVLELNVPSATVAVHCEDRNDSVVMLEAVDAGDREAARLIENTTATSDGDRFVVRVPRPSGTTVGGAGSVFVTSNGNVIVSGGATGVTIVNGRVITGNAAVVYTRGLRITARVPTGSTIVADGQTTDITVHGPARQVKATTVSGDVDVSAAGTVRARSTSGDLRIGDANDVVAQMVSGDVRVRRLAGHANIHTVSGDITVHAVDESRVFAKAVSGDIDITADPGVEVDADTRTVSGRTRNSRRR